MRTMPASVTQLFDGSLFHGNAPFYIVVAAVVVLVFAARRIRFIGTLLTLGLVGVSLAILVPMLRERAAFDPAFDRVAQTFRLEKQGQQIVGKEMRIPMARDGHFWVRVKIGATEQRMLVDSGATITALSDANAAAAGLVVKDPAFPMVLQTANGSIKAQTATVREMRIGNIVARNLPVVVSPAFGDMSVIGMNFLSRLKSWRVEGKTLILEPHHPQSA
jgi:aspartyl protease family protein